MFFYHFLQVVFWNMDTPAYFSVIFTKENNFCDFLFASPHKRALWKKGQLWPLRVTRIKKEGKKKYITAELLSLKVYFILKNDFHFSVIKCCICKIYTFTVLSGNILKNICCAPLIRTDLLTFIS